MAKKKTSKKSEDSFADTIGRLQAIVDSLESGEMTLEESLKLYEEGAKCLKSCREKLTTAKRKIELLSGVNDEGNAVTSDFEDDEFRLE